MAKKGNLPLIYLAGMALVVIGFCCPIFKFMGTKNGFSFIDFDHFGFLTIGFMLVFAGAVLGILTCFLPQLAGLKLIATAVSILGGVIVVIGCFNDGFYKAIGKQFLKNAQFGFYVLVVGWLAAIFGVLKNK